MYVPFNYEHINIAAGTYNPSPVKAYNNYSYAYWCRSLIQRIRAVYEFKLPDLWAGPVKDFFYWCLLRYGYVAVFKRDKYGLMFQPCNISGVSVYYQPTRATISNPAFKDSFDLEIGTECELIKLTPDYFGIWDIIQRYAGELSTLDNGINSALINSKFAWLLGARSKSAAEALKKALDKINKGEPAVVVDAKLMSGNKPGTDESPFELLDFNVKDNYILTDLLADFQTILNNFDAEAGIPTVPYQKKERMVTTESTMRMFDGSARAEVYLDCLQSSIDMVNKMFDSDIQVELRYPAPDQSESEVTDNGEQ